MTEKQQYEDDKLKTIVNKFEFLFATVIRTKIFDNSIEMYMNFLRQFLPSMN